MSSLKYFQLWFQSCICKLCRKGAWARVGKYAHASTVSRLWFSIVSLIPGSFFSRVLEKTATMYNSNKKYLNSGRRQFAFAQADFQGPRIGYPRVFFQELIEVEFEGYSFMSFKNWDRYLRVYYYDYMKLPPIEKRVGVAPISKISFGDDV